MKLPEELRPAPGRVPPHDLDAEAAVLSAVFLVPTEIDSLIGSLRFEMFYSDANKFIFEAMENLQARGDSIDIISVASELRRTDKLGRAGGTPYLADISDKVPAVANVASYADIVRDKWQARRVILDCQLVIAEAYTGSEPSLEIIQRAENTLGDLASTAVGSELVPVGEIIKSEVVLRSALRESGDTGRGTGTSTGYAGLDKLTGGLQDGDVTLIAGRPSMGKTSFTMNLIANVARSGTDDEPAEGTAFFSIEMPKEQVALRFACAERGVSVTGVRRNSLRADEWEKFLEGAADLERFPIWVDDSPNLSLLDVRARARKLQREIARGKSSVRCRRLGLVVIDYLQLMRGVRERGDNRENEVAGISRGLKILAKDLGIHVIGVSQVNRGPEERGRKDRRPELGQLRECVTGDTRIYDPTTGCSPTIESLVGHAAHVLSLDPHGRLRPLVGRVHASGTKTVYRLTTQTGREIRASGDHPFLTIDGWVPLAEIAIGTEIAVPRAYTTHARSTRALSVEEARLVGYLIGNGSYQKHRSVSFTHPEREIVDDCADLARQVAGVEAKEHPHWSGCPQIDFRKTKSAGYRNPLVEWLKRLGIYDQVSHEKAVPALAFCSPRRSIAALVAGLWATDGTVVPLKGRWTLKYTSTSRVLLQQMQHLLLRLGVISFLTPPTRHSKSTKDIATLLVSGKHQIGLFAMAVELLGKKGAKLRKAAAWARAGKRNERIDRLPLKIERDVAALRETAGLSWAALGYRCQGKRIGRDNLAAVAKKLGNERLADLATSDVLWDPVVSIERQAKERVYDVVVPGHHNFVANDFVIHNSGALEQDADNVWFVYRPGYYDKDARPTDAELLIRKQRNGATGVIGMAFAGETMRFLERALENYDDLSQTFEDG
jgi:replicative DNA helicase